MNVEIGAEAALFPEKEYINGIAVAVRAERGSRGVNHALELIKKMKELLEGQLEGQLKGQLKGLWIFLFSIKDQKLCGFSSFGTVCKALDSLSFFR